MKPILKNSKAVSKTKLGAFIYPKQHFLFIVPINKSEHSSNEAQNFVQNRFFRKVTQLSCIKRNLYVRF